LSKIRPTALSERAAQKPVFYNQKSTKSTVPRTPSGGRGISKSSGPTAPQRASYPKSVLFGVNRLDLGGDAEKHFFDHFCGQKHKKNTKIARFLAKNRHSCRKKVKNHHISRTACLVYPSSLSGTRCGVRITQHIPKNYIFYTHTPFSAQN